VRQLNQPGWVYTWTFMGFSITRRDISSQGVLYRHGTANVVVPTGACLARPRYHTLVGNGLTSQESTKPAWKAEVSPHQC
jgi:hypothetical protein